MQLISCGRERAEEILAILNDAIAHTTTLYDYEPRDMAAMDAWFDLREKRGIPVIGMETDDGTLAGFATYSPFRSQEGYKFTAEHSVYVDRPFRRQGLGRELMRHLVSCARTGGYHMLIGVIDASNEASIALHRKLGFENCGHIKHAGFKFGRWRDVELWQLILV